MPSPPRKVAIVGAGAIGASLGAALHTRVGEDVVLVARGARRDALARGGVRLTGTFGNGAVRLPVTDKPPADADVTVVAVKTPDLPGALEAIATSGSGGPVVTLQNGLDAEKRAMDRLDPARVIGCITAFDATATAGSDADEGFPVHVSARMGGLILGRPMGHPDAVVRDLAARWGRALPIRVTGDLPGARWTKLIVNLNNAIPAVTGLSIQDVFRDARLARLSARMLKETVAVARAEGVHLRPLPAVNPALIRVLATLPDPLTARLLAFRVHRVLGPDPTHGSTWQSVVRGRATEVDDLNGAVVQRGRARRLPVAANAAVTRGVRRVAESGRFWSVERLLQEVRPED